MWKRLITPNILRVRGCVFVREEPHENEKIEMNNEELENGE